MAERKKVVVVDDDAEMGKLVKDVLEAEGYTARQFTSASEALVKIKEDLPHVIITDLRMRDIDGMMFLKKLQADYPSIVCIMMTAFGSVETAIEAMKSGAYHYIIKPFKVDEMTLLVKRAFERAHLLKENKTLKKQLRKEFSLDSMIGKSQQMLDLFELIKKVSQANANVMVNGESGTGKELVARSIHELGPRKSKAFVAVNCTAIPETLLESELFGHVKGSFTGAHEDKKGLFEAANGGTLFLDEIGDLSLPMQAKILRVLQEKQIRPVGSNQFKDIDVRIISATHRNLKNMVTDGSFREDLYFRLNVIPLLVPSLHERQTDIPLLVEHFVEKYALQNNSKVHGVDVDAMAALMAHPWPGNVRELQNVIERAVVLSSGELITKSEILGSATESAAQSIQNLFSDRPTLEMLEERYIKLVLAEAKFKKEEAVKVLGISRRTLYRKERAYGLISAEVEEPAEDEQYVTQ